MEVRKKRSFINTFIDVIEKGGNKLPHPFILFATLTVITVLASYILSLFNLEVTYFSGAKKAGEVGQEISVNVVNLLSIDNLRYMVTKFPDIFGDYAPLRLVLIMTAASAFIEKTGFFETLMKKYLLKAPKSMITFAVVFVAINANLMSGAGTIFAISIGAVTFSALGRNPLIGSIIGFVGASGGFTANLFLAGTDALLSGITESAVQNMGINITINPAVNYFFMASATIFLSITVTLFTEKVVVKMIGDGDGQERLNLLEHYHLTSEQEKGLKWAGYGFIFFIVIMLLLTIPENSFFRNEKGYFLPKSPFFEGIVFVISFLFLSTGIPYGIVTGQIKKSKDIPRIISLGLKQAIPFLTTAIMASLFTDLLNKSNIFKIIAIKGAEVLKETNVGLIPLCLAVVLVTTLINPFMMSGSSKWLLISPMVVPIFVLLNINPAYAQLAFRVGDSCTNIISPLHSALPVIIGLMLEYQAEGKIPLRPGETEQREIGMGTIFSLTVPYSMVLLFTMVFMMIIWLVFNLPIGPGVSLYLM